MEQIDVRILDRDYPLAVGPDEKPRLIEAAALVDQTIKDGCDANIIRSRVGMLAAFAARIRP